MTVKAVELSAEQAKKLQQLINSIPKIISKLENKDYDEIFGYRIAEDGKEYVEAEIRDEILCKFLIANDWDVATTIDRVANTINWRHKFDPLSAAYNEKFPADLNKLGVITVFPKETIPNYKVGTWNLYGHIVSPKVLFEKFGDSSGSKEGTVFLRWRVGLMEKSLSFLDYQDPTNSKIVQIHDYNNVSMFRVDKNMRASTKEIIQIFGDNYPELLSTKFFINVPSIMSWVFNFFSTIGIISKETLNKFRPLNHGNLSEWFNEDLPKVYGGKSTKSIFDFDSANKAKIPKYGSVLLEKSNEEVIGGLNLSVE